MISTIWGRLNPPYRTIVADPPWPYGDGATLGQRSSGRTRFLPYSVMTMAEIASLPVADLGVCDAHLYLWTTERFLWQAPKVLDAWGFVQSDLLVWCKPPGGSVLGSAFTPATEFVVFGRRKWGDAIRECAWPRSACRAQSAPAPWCAGRTGRPWRSASWVGGRHQRTPRCTRCNGSGPLLSHAHALGPGRVSRG